MSETRPLANGEQLVLELRRFEARFAAADNELLAAIATVLRAFADQYDLQPHHLDAAGRLKACLCATPYLRLAQLVAAP